MIDVSSMTEGSISISTVVAGISGILALGASAYGVLLRFSASTYEKATERRFQELEKASEENERDLKKEVKEQTDKSHALEKTVIELKGDLARVHERSERIDDIANNMVTRREWEKLERQMEEVLKTLRGRYGTGTSTPNFPAVTGVSEKSK